MDTLPLLNNSKTHISKRCKYFLIIAFFITLLICIITGISLYIVKNNIRIAVLPALNISTNSAILEGKIDVFYSVPMKYQFEYGIQNYYIPILTPLIQLNHSCHVSVPIFNLYHDTNYIYRLIVYKGIKTYMNSDYYISNNGYFKTLITSNTDIEF